MVIGVDSYLVFRLATEWLGIPTRVLQEVTPLREIRTLPHRRQGVVLGVVNVRGELVICAGLDRALGVAQSDGPHGETASEASHQRLLIARREGDRFAFPVDHVHGITRFPPGDIREVPSTVSRGGHPCTHGIALLEGRSVGLIDDERLFHLLNRSLG